MYISVRITSVMYIVNNHYSENVWKFTTWKLKCNAIVQPRFPSCNKQGCNFPQNGFRRWGFPGWSLKFLEQSFFRSPFRNCFGNCYTYVALNQQCHIIWQSLIIYATRAVTPPHMYNGIAKKTKSNVGIKFFWQTRTINLCDNASDGIIAWTCCYYQFI